MTKLLAHMLRRWYVWLAATGLALCIAIVILVAPHPGEASGVVCGIEAVTDSTFVVRDDRLGTDPAERVLVNDPEAEYRHLLFRTATLEMFPEIFCGHNNEVRFVYYEPDN